MSRSWNFTTSAPASWRQVDQLLGERDRALVVDPDLADQQRRVARADHVAADAQVAAAVDREGRQVTALVDQRDHLDTWPEQRCLRGRVGGDGGPDAGRPGDRLDALAQIDVGLLVTQRRKSPSENDPCSRPCSSTEKTRPDLLALILFSAARIVSSAKTMYGAVWRSMIMVVLSDGDRGGCGGGFDHDQAPVFRAARVRAASSKSSRVSMSTPSEGSMTNKPMRPPRRLCSRSYTSVRVR